MRQRSMVFILIIIALVTSFLVLLLSKIIPLSNALPLGISLLALFVSILSSFKNELFPFRLSIFSNMIHLVAVKPITPFPGKSIVVLLPITFFNQGYSEGIIEEVELILTSEKSKIRTEYLPISEIDMVSFMQQMKGLNSSNTLGAFAGFLLEPKRAMRKNIVFSPMIEPGFPPVIWQPGVYSFEIFVKVYGEKENKKYFEIKQTIDENSLRSLVTGKIESLVFYPDKI